MAKKPTTVAPPLKDGDVSRSIDFNLKKEDIMLLILEGKKEVMEEEIGKLQSKANKLQQEFDNAQERLTEKVKALVLNSLTPEAKVFISPTGKDITEEVSWDDEKENHLIRYSQFVCQQVGDKGSCYVRQEIETFLKIELTREVKLQVTPNYRKFKFFNNNSIFKKEPNPGTAEHPDDIIIFDDYLSIPAQKTLPEFKECVKIADELIKVIILRADIVSEYDMFNRNQPRSKAKMIKEVLNRDANGQAILESITQAAKGVKLLS